MLPRMRALLAALVLVPFAALPALADLLPPDAPACNDKQPGAACTTHAGAVGTCQEQTSERLLPPPEGSTEPVKRTTTHVVCVASGDAAVGDAVAKKGFQQPVAVAIALGALGLAVGLFVRMRHKKPAGAAILALACFLLTARVAAADVLPEKPDPAEDQEKTPPTQPDPEKTPAENTPRIPAETASLLGAAALLAIGVYGARRLSVSSTRRQPAS
jgi:hypothetical protein